MRLINTKTLHLEEYFNEDVPSYAILSHCWELGNEVSYDEYRRKPSPYKLQKVSNFCALARSVGLDYGWVDTCCIDKSSSAELTEAINSMYTWYKRSEICFVFLNDYKSKDADVKVSALIQCRWFRRGWCLQELIAPRKVRFFDAELRYLGTKDDFRDGIAFITSVPTRCLTHQTEPGQYSVAQRMSWASNRTTTRTEDMAYCLMGLFNVNMPLLYGEGTKAFQRLQQVIISQSDDHSIFTWLSLGQIGNTGVLASSPAEFAITGNIRPIHFQHKPSPPAITGRGLQIHLTYYDAIQVASTELWDSLIGTRSGSIGKYGTETITLRLDCEITDFNGTDHWIGVKLSRDPTTGTWHRSQAGSLFCSRQSHYFRRVYPFLHALRTLYVSIEPRIERHADLRFLYPYKIGAWKDKMAVYTRPGWLNILFLIAKINSASAMIWVVNLAHRLCGLPAPGMVSTWACMTLMWVLEGQNLHVLMSLVIYGLIYKGNEFNTYGIRDAVIALMQLLPMSCLHYAVHGSNWIELKDFWHKQICSHSEAADQQSMNMSTYRIAEADSVMTAWWMDQVQDEKEKQDPCEDSDMPAK